LQDGRLPFRLGLARLRTSEELILSFHLLLFVSRTQRRVSLDGAAVIGLIVCEPQLICDNPKQRRPSTKEIEEVSVTSQRYLTPANGSYELSEADVATETHQRVMKRVRRTISGKTFPWARTVWWP